MLSVFKPLFDLFKVIIRWGFGSWLRGALSAVAIAVIVALGHSVSPQVGNEAQRAADEAKVAVEQEAVPAQ